MVFRSFRDPASALELHDDSALRFIRPEAEDFVRSLLARPEIQKEVGEGRLVSAQPIPGDSHGLVLRHEKITPVSYPHEWPPAVLREAGKLILHMARLALDIGLGLKDATPYNVQFRGSRPVFVDWTSFEQPEPDDPIWRPLAQFSGTVLLPLLVWRDVGVPPKLFFQESREGIAPELAARLIPGRQRLLGAGLRHVTLPVMLSRRVKPSHYQVHHASSPEKAAFVIRHMLDGLEKDLDSLAGFRGTSTLWSEYMKQNTARSYSSEAFAGKNAIVERILLTVRPQRVLDIGCNTGFFSILAAKAVGSFVLSIDQDVDATNCLAVRSIHENLPILPLQVSVTNPTPALGWCNQEFQSFVERMRCAFDLVMMLAVIHHLEICERVPLQHVLALAAHFSRRYVLVEFVPLEDPMARQLLRGREYLHSTWTRENFERAAAELFGLKHRVPVPDSQRTLYLLEKK